MKEVYSYRVYVQKPGVTGQTWKDVSIVSTSDKKASRAAIKLTLQEYPVGYTASTRLMSLKPF